LFLSFFDLLHVNQIKTIDKDFKTVKSRTNHTCITAELATIPSKTVSPAGFALHLLKILYSSAGNWIMHIRIRFSWLNWKVLFNKIQVLMDHWQNCPQFIWWYGKSAKSTAPTVCSQTHFLFLAAYVWTNIAHKSVNIPCVRVVFVNYDTENCWWETKWRREQYAPTRLQPITAI